MAGAAPSCCLFLLLLLLLILGSSSAQDVYQLGVGIADVTGPAAEIGMVSPLAGFP